MAVTIRNLVKRYGSTPVLKGISLTVEDGQFVSLLGPSGCGKTTLLQSIAGLVTVEGGEILVDGTVWSSADTLLATDRRHVGLVFQDLALWPHMNVFENIAFGLKIKRWGAKEIRDRVESVLATVDMTSYRNHAIHELSGGQRQRIAIARALALSPRLILMDEPLSALDAKLRERMRWELRDMMKRANTTTIYVTHDQMEALSMSDHVVLMNQGEVVQQGAPHELYHHPRTVFAADFLGASNIFPCEVRKTGAELEWKGVALPADIPPGAGEGAPVTATTRPHAIRVEPYRGGGTGTGYRGEVVSAIFQGSHWTYRIRLDENGEMVEAAKDAVFYPGDVVLVSFPPGSVIVLEDGPSPSGDVAVAKRGVV